MKNLCFVVFILFAILIGIVACEQKPNTNQEATYKKRKQDSLKIESLLDSLDLDLDTKKRETLANQIISLSKPYQSSNRKDRFFVADSKCNACKNLAEVYRNYGDYNKSLAIANEGLDASNMANPKSYKMQVYLLNEKARVYLRQKKWGEGVICASKCKQLIEKYNISIDSNYIALCLNSYSQNLTQLAKKTTDTAFLKAIQLNKQAQKLTNKPHYKSAFIYDLAFAYEVIYNYRNALQIYHSLEKRDRSELEKDVYAGMLDNMGFCYTNLKKFDKAQAYFQASLDTLLQGKKDFQSVTYKYYATELLKDYGDMWLAYYQTNPNKTYLENALQKYEALDKLIDEMRASQTEGSKIFWRSSAHELYENALEICLLLKNPEKAYYFMEKSKAVVLWENLKANQIIDKNTPQLSLKSVQEKLRENKQNLVEYFIGKNTIYALTLTATNIQLQKCYENRYAEFQQMVDTYLSLCQLNEQEAKLVGKQDFQQVYLSRIQAKFTETAYNLYQNLLKNLPLTSNQIIISTDEQLLPFETLLDAQSDDWEKHFLINRYTFSYAYSSSLYFGNYTQQNNDGKLLGVAPFAIKNSLENSDVSLKVIHQTAYDGTDLVNEKATEKAFTDKVNKYGIVHFYSHAKGGEQASIRLNDKSLTLADIYKLKLQPNLVVLGACETGIGTIEKGEGVMSLARGFAYAGVPATLTTLWSVDNTYIYDLMEIFYQNLAKGMTKDQALTLAKRTLMQKDNKNTLPLNIGSTILIGQNLPILPNKSSNQKIYIIVALFATLGILYLSLRNRRFKK